MTDFDLALILWRYHNVRVDPKQSDIILGLGSYDIRVADHCAALYLAGIAGRVVFTGASGNWTQELWDAPEAEVFSRRAVNQGVPQDAILKECEATNIAENLKLTQRLLAARSLNIEAVTIVTKPNTLRRVSACLAVQWPSVDAFLTAPPMTLEEQITPQRSLPDLINEMVGDFQRILIYPTMGYAIPQKNPKEVRDAFYTLVERGYVAHLMGDQPLPVRTK
ncbi:YdcF family protein [Verrucomicrobia bacterium]|nr:YdcF family protein [Verrucomicrobiota bacterium]MDB4798903.1 YdcF family protein [Verrucomicrobiota bacterium]